MHITSAILENLRVGFKTLYTEGLGMARPMWNRVAEEVPSTHLEENYGWLADVPGMREWIGPRVIHSLKEADFRVVNKDWELTIGVDRNRIEDDSLGIYSSRFRRMGSATGAQYDLSIWPQLKLGFSTLCFDGQYFFDTDHPVIGANGQETSVSNFQGGSGTPWYLLDTTRMIRPLILQKRKPYNFVAKTAETDDNVFDRKEYVWGVDARLNVGYGLWQLAYASKEALDATSFGEAYAEMQSLKGDNGRPLGIRPKLLVVPPSLREKALEVVKAERNAAGATNINRDVVDVLVTPWLA